MEKMVTDLAPVYKGKKVFVTGHTGFKGSWLITWLFQLGAQIKGYALAPENTNDLYNAIRGDELCASVIADIRDQKRVTEEILNFQPDFIFHLAAQPLVRLSYEKPTYTFEVNAQGTAYVLDALRLLAKPCVAVMITTDKVYENLETGHYYKETDRLGGYDPYSASKACAELIIDSYRNSFFNPDDYEQHRKSVSSARAGNVIGGGDWATDRIIPDIIRSLNEKKPIVLRNPSSVRPWQHVLEPLQGYMTLATKQLNDPKRFSTAFNFGPNPENAFPVSMLAAKALQVWGEGEVVNEEKGNSSYHEAGLLHLDINKAVAELGWTPDWDSCTTIEKTIIWYKKFLLNKEDARKLIEADIHTKTQKHD